MEFLKVKAEDCSAKLETEAVANAIKKNAPKPQISHSASKETPTLVQTSNRNYSHNASCLWTVYATKKLFEHYKANVNKQIETYTRDDLFALIAKKLNEELKTSFTGPVVRNRHRYVLRRNRENKQIETDDKKRTISAGNAASNTSKPDWILDDRRNNPKYPWTDEEITSLIDLYEANKNNVGLKCPIASKEALYTFIAKKLNAQLNSSLSGGQVGTKIKSLINLASKEHNDEKSIESNSNQGSSTSSTQQHYLNSHTQEIYADEKKAKVIPPPSFTKFSELKIKVLSSLFHNHQKEIGYTKRFKTKNELLTFITNKMNHEFNTKLTLQQVELRISSFKTREGKTNRNIELWKSIIKRETDGKQKGQTKELRYDSENDEGVSWTKLQTKTILDIHEANINNVGKAKTFKTEHELWEYITSRTNKEFNRSVSVAVAHRRYMKVMRNSKSTTNKTAAIPKRPRTSSESSSSESTFKASNEMTKKEKIKLKRNQWSETQLQALIDIYNANINNVGIKGKKFRSKKKLFEYVAKKINKRFKTKFLPVSVERRYKLFLESLGKLRGEMQSETESRASNYNEISQCGSLESEIDVMLEQQQPNVYWNARQTRKVLQLFAQNMNDVGMGKRFKNKEILWKFIAGEMAAIFSLTFYPMQVRNKILLVLNRQMNLNKTRNGHRKSVLMTDKKKAEPIKALADSLTTTFNTVCSSFDKVCTSLDHVSQQLDRVSQSRIGKPTQDSLVLHNQTKKY